MLTTISNNELARYGRTYLRRCLSCFSKVKRGNYEMRNKPKMTEILRETSRIKKCYATDSTAVWVIWALISNFRRVLNVVFFFWMIPRRINSDARESSKRKNTIWDLFAATRITVITLSKICYRSSVLPFILLLVPCSYSASSYYHYYSPFLLHHQQSHYHQYLFLSSSFTIITTFFFSIFFFFFSSCLFFHSRLVL